MLKITQIIPAPSDLQVEYTDDDGNKGTTRVICLALVETEKSIGIVPVTKWAFNERVGCLDASDISLYDRVLFD